MFYAQSTSTVIMSGRSKVTNLMFYVQSTSTVIMSGRSKVSNLMFYAQSTSTVILSGRSKVSNLMFYAQLTSMVISGLFKVGSMETETLKSGHGGENNEVTHCPIQMTVNLNLEARLTKMPLEG